MSIPSVNAIHTPASSAASAASATSLPSNQLSPARLMRDIGSARASLTHIQSYHCSPYEAARDLLATVKTTLDCLQREHDFIRVNGGIDPFISGELELVKLQQQHLALTVNIYLRQVDLANRMSQAASALRSLSASRVTNNASAATDPSSVLPTPAPRPAAAVSTAATMATAASSGINNSVTSTAMATPLIARATSLLSGTIALRPPAPGANSMLAGATLLAPRLPAVNGATTANTGPMPSPALQATAASAAAMAGAGPAPILSATPIAQAILQASAANTAANAGAPSTAVTAATAAATAAASGPCRIALVGQLAFDPNTVSLAGQRLDPNKRHVYDALTAGRTLRPFHFAKYRLENPAGMDNTPLFAGVPANRVDPRYNASAPISFRYDPDTADTMHWTANFADSHLFFACHDSLLAQDELQVLEHPGIGHLKVALNGSPAGPDGTPLPVPPSPLAYIDSAGTEVALLTGVQRLGILDTSTAVPSSDRGLYGNAFAGVPTTEIDSRLTRVDTTSNIAAFVAPRYPGPHGQPYSLIHIRRFFNAICATCKAIKDNHGAPGRRHVLHSGNSGCGAFGNNPKLASLLQLAATRYFGVDLTYHPMFRTENAAYTAAKALFEQIEKQHPNMTVGEFLQHLADNAETYNLRYGSSNGT